MGTQIQSITADELFRMSDNGKRLELVAGELREMSPAGFEHGRISMCLAGPLNEFVEQRRLGVIVTNEPGFLLSQNPDTVRAPDAAFVTQERLAKLTKIRGYFPGAPDLAVEVISPNDIYSDVEEKVEAWLIAGCRMVVVANPRNKTLKVYRSQTDLKLLTIMDTFDGQDVVPGFQLALTRIFPN